MIHRAARSAFPAAVLIGGVLCAALVAAGCAARRPPVEVEVISPTPPTSDEAAPAPVVGKRSVPTLKADAPPIRAVPGRMGSLAPPAAGLPRPVLAVRTAASIPARLEVTVYEVRLPADRIRDLDAVALAAKAASPAALEKVLAELGPTRALYQIDQVVDLAGASIRVGKREPFVTGSRVREGGAFVNSVQYQEVGLILEVATVPAKDAASAAANVLVKGELSAMTEGAAEVAKGTKAAVIRNASFTATVPADMGGPFVMLSADASSADADGKAIAYVWRSRISEVRP